MTCCRSDTARKNEETVTDNESDRKTAPPTARQRARVISSSSDEDVNECNEQQVITTEYVIHGR